MKYLFARWVNLKKDIIDKYIILFLDYDGTLSPIADTPHQAIIPKETKALLKELTKSLRVKIAIISGRSLSDIKALVGLKDIIYAGNHGLEIEGPKIKFEPLVSLRCKAVLEQIKNDLNKRLSSINGAFVEDKGLSLSLHYRLVDKKNIPQVKAIFHETIILYLVRNKIKIKTGKMVLEVRPPSEWGKGKIVLWLLVRQKFALKDKDVVPIYIGDDTTDEDAFKVLKNNGITIFVGKPKPSYAQYYLKDTNEVKEFLKRILLMQSDKNICQSK